MRKRARMCESTLTSDDDDDENRIAYRARNIFHRHFRKRAYIYIQMFGIYVDRVVLALLYILTPHIAISYVCIFHYSLRVEHCASDVLLSASLVPPTLPRIYTSVWLLYSFVAVLKRCNFSRWTWHDMLLLRRRCVSTLLADERDGVCVRDVFFVIVFVYDSRWCYFQSNKWLRFCAIGQQHCTQANTGRFREEHI